MASLSLEWSRPSMWPNSWVAIHRRFVPWGLLSVNVSASSKWARPSSGMNAYASCPPGPSNRSGHLFPSPPPQVVSITKTESRNLKVKCPCSQSRSRVPGANYKDANTGIYQTFELLNAVLLWNLNSWIPYLLDHFPLQSKIFVMWRPISRIACVSAFQALRLESLWKRIKLLRSR